MTVTLTFGGEGPTGILSQVAYVAFTDVSGFMSSWITIYISYPQAAQGMYHCNVHSYSSFVGTYGYR